MEVPNSVVSLSGLRAFVVVVTVLTEVFSDGVTVVVLIVVLIVDDSIEVVVVVVVVVSIVEPN